MSTAGWAAVASRDGLRVTSGGNADERPWVADADGVACLVAGELRNRGELAAALGGPGDPAALALRAYRRWGDGFVGRLRGSCSAIVVDRARGQTLAARDALGFQPLFFAMSADGLAFSDAVAVLLAVPGVDATPDRTALAEYLLHRWPAVERTFHVAVHRLPPGRLARFDRSGRPAGDRRFWDPFGSDGAPRWLAENEVGQFAERFQAAVGGALDSGPSAIFLSGGLDSVSIAAVAADECQRRGLPPPLALSLVFPDPECNEEESQRAIARALGLPLVILGLEEAAGPSGLLQASLELSAAFDTPLQNFWLPAYLRLAAEAQRAGRATILTGGGGDEWLTVDPIYTADLLRQGRVLSAARLLGVYGRSYRLPYGRLARSVLWSNGVRPLAQAWARSAAHTLVPGMLARRRARAVGRTVEGFPDWFAPDRDLRRALADSIARDADAGALRSARLPRHGFYVQQFQRFLEHPLLTLEIEEDHETLRRFGWRKAQPFWDAELVEFLYRVRPELLNRNGANKGLVRDMLERRFPELGFERQKKVVSIDFFRATLFAEAPRAWQRMGGVPALASLGVVDTARADAMVRSVLATRDAAAVYRVWDLLNLEAWTRPRVSRDGTTGLTEPERLVIDEAAARAVLRSPPPS